MIKSVTNAIKDYPYKSTTKPAEQSIGTACQTQNTYPTYYKAIKKAFTECHSYDTSPRFGRDGK